MSYGDLRVKVGRRPIVVVEIDLDFSQNTYGTSPCTAAVGTTGASKCYNTFRSCQDVENYNLGTKTYSFCSNTGVLPIGQNLFPCITDIDITPTQLVPEDFAISAAVTVTMQDFPWHDRGIDPYVSGRTYDAEGQGSFFGKLRARNPYLNNRVMRVKTGYVDGDRQIYTITRTYLIDHVEGPDADGAFRLVGKDPLRYTDDDKYQVPVASKGTLFSDVTADEVTSMTLATGTTSDYPSAGVVRVDDELIAYTSIVNDALVGLTRGYLGTTVDTHSASAKVQQCVTYSNQTPPDIIADLLQTYAQIDPSFITVSDWEANAATWLPSFTSTVVLSDPASVKDVIKEILQATGSTLWWDEEGAQIRWEVLIPFLIKQDVTILNDSQNIIQGSTQQEDEEDQRVSRVLTYWKLGSPIDDVDQKNFQTIAIQIDSDTESVDAYGTPQALEILSRWSNNESLVNAIGNRYLYRNRTTPRQITLQVDAKDATARTGDLRDIVSSLVQDFDGSSMNVRYMVIETHEMDPGTTWEYKLIQVAPRGGLRAPLFAPNTTNVWTSATADEKKNYMFISNDNGFMSDGSLAPHIC